MVEGNPDLEYESDPVGPNRTVLIVAGGAVLALSIALVILRAARAKPKPTENPLYSDEVSPAVRASIEHLAAAFDLRFVGVDTRLEQLAEALVANNAGNAPATPAAVSLPTNPIADIDPDLMQPPPQPQVGALEPPPPQPASVSM